MTSVTNDLRDQLRGEVMSEPNIWFDLSYRLRWNAEKEDFEFADLQQVKSTNNRTEKAE